jgi:hypothetical protein
MVRFAHCIIPVTTPARISIISNKRMPLDIGHLRVRISDLNYTQKKAGNRWASGVLDGAGKQANLEMDAASGGDGDAFREAPETGFPHPQLMVARGHREEPDPHIEEFPVQGDFGAGGFHVQPDQAVADGNAGRGRGNFRRAAAGNEPAQQDRGQRGEKRAGSEAGRDTGRKARKLDHCAQL